jgi:hypothetical protein
MQEIKHLRTRFSKHFATSEPGKYEAQISGEPLHYRTPSGDWDDMTDLIKEVDGGWAAATSDVRFGIEGGYLTISRNNKSIQMRPTAIGMVDRTAPATRWRKLADANYGTVERVDGGKFIIHDIFPNTDLAVTITEDSMAKSFTVRERPNLPDPTTLGWDASKTYLVIVWDVQKSAGVTVRDSVSQAVVGNGYVGNNDLNIEDPQGNTVIVFKAGVGTSAIGRKNPVWYIVAGANVPFGEAYAYEKAAIATYPLELDPTAQLLSSGGARYGSIDGDGYTGTTFFWGDNSWYDEGDPKINGDESWGGGNYATFAGYDLTAIPANATCTSAKMTAPVFYQTSNGIPSTMSVNKLNSDWYPIDVNDANIGYSSIGSYNFTGVDFGLGSGGLFFCEDGILYAALYSNPYYPLKKSTDGGKTWTMVNNYLTQWAFDSYGGRPIYLASSGKYYRRWSYTVSYYSSTMAGSEYSFTGTYPQYETTMSLANGRIYLGGVGDVGSTTRSFGLSYTTNTSMSPCTLPSYGVGTTWGVGDVIWNGSQYMTTFLTASWGVTTSTGATLRTMTSSDGVTWSNGVAIASSQNANTMTYASRLFYSGGRYFAIPPNGSIYTSTDGTNWSLSYSYAGSSSYFDQGIYYVNGSWYFLHQYQLYKSSNGTSWSQVTRPTFVGSPNVITSNGSAIHVSSLPTTTIGAYDGTTWSEISAFNASLNTSAVQASFGSWLPIRVIPSSFVSSIYNQGAPGLIVAYESASGPTWVSPTDATNIPPNTSLVWTSVVDASPVHFQLDMASDSGFTSNLVSKRSYLDSGFEYWDGAAWQALTSAGMPANKTGNQVRYTPTGQASGTFYRRVRQGK